MFVDCLIYVPTVYLCILACLQMYSFSASEFMWSFLIKNREVSPEDQAGERECLMLKGKGLICDVTADYPS